MKLLQAFVMAGFLGAQGLALAKDLACPSLQLMQIDWQGGDKEAMEAAKKSMAAAGFKVTGGSTYSIVGQLDNPVAEGFILTHAKTASVTSVAIACICAEPMDALTHAQALRTQMEKTPSAGRQVKGSYSAIWVQEGDDSSAKLKPWTKVLSFTWHGPSEQAGITAEQGLRDMGFQNIKGGGINPAHSATKPAEQLTAVVTYSPINDVSARVHVLMTGYGPQARMENYCNDLKSIILYDNGDQPEAKAPSNTSLAAEVNRVVEKEMQDGRLPGMAVGVLLNNKVAYLHGYGLAQGFDPDHMVKPALPKVSATENTLFRWGSVIKTVTATTALRLMEDGKLNLDANVQDYVPTFPAKTDPVTKKTTSLTAHYLLCHESGLPHYPDKTFFKSDDPFNLNIDDWDPMDTLGYFEQSTLMFSPGSQTHYSSYGYMLLSAVIEKAGGAQFVDLVQKQVIQPLGLKTLAVDRSTGPAAPGHAEGYTRDAAGHVIVRQAVDLAWKTGAGAYASNVKDLAHWAEALLQHKLMKPATYNLAWTHQVLTNGKTSGLGLGFFLGKDGNNQLTVSHNGLADIAGCQMTLYPLSGEGVVIMCNCVPGTGYAGPNLGKLADEIRDAAHTAVTK